MVTVHSLDLVQLDKASTPDEVLTRVEVGMLALARFRTLTRSGGQPVSRLQSGDRSHLCYHSMPPWLATDVVHKPVLGLSRRSMAPAKAQDAHITFAIVARILHQDERPQQGLD